MTNHGVMLEKFLSYLAETESSLQVGKAKSTLCVWMKNSNGIGELRCKVIYDWIVNGNTFKDDKIVFTSGGFVDAGEITKAGVNFAKFIDKDLVRLGACP